jgi:hypothetical protein
MNPTRRNAFSSVRMAGIRDMSLEIWTSEFGIPDS